MKLTRRRVIIGIIVLVVICAALASRSPQQEQGTATPVVVTRTATSLATPRAVETATATSTATLAPSPTQAQPSPSPAPATVPPAPAITIELIRLTSPIAKGSDAVLQIRTTPGARCSLSYTTPIGTASEAQGLGPTLADGNGVCAWTWRIGPTTTPGIGRLRVSVDGVGQGYEIEVQ